MESLSSRIALCESNNKRSLGIAKRNRRNHDNVARSERLGHIVAERVAKVRGLDERIRDGICLPMIDLMNILDVAIDGQAADLVYRQPELERAIRGTVDGDVEAVIAHQYVNLEGVACGKRGEVGR